MPLAKLLIRSFFLSREMLMTRMKTMVTQGLEFSASHNNSGSFTVMTDLSSDISV